MTSVVAAFRWYRHVLLSSAKAKAEDLHFCDQRSAKLG
jgi:hypothetical protein